MEKFSRHTGDVRRLMRSREIFEGLESVLIGRLEVWKMCHMTNGFDLLTRNCQTALFSVN